MYLVPYLSPQTLTEVKSWLSNATDRLMIEKEDEMAWGQFNILLNSLRDMDLPREYYRNSYVLRNKYTRGPLYASTITKLVNMLLSAL